MVSWQPSGLSNSCVASANEYPHDHQATSDKLLGGAMLFVAAFVFIYYTIWALLLPFISSDSSIHTLFPPREWAIKLPLLLLLSGITAVGLFFTKVMFSEARKKAAKGGKKV
ncbi:uncharacterized protein I303_101835 [Kwoniella dejecticola CBS 10117]|uniref:Dolichol phosphate-mannose biosynthesis regulatory protein n=1 Tax=Kwoniella dejecticola CBS 10117 TaxID=1296121 RepID=A0A1A6ACN3_9TREE|nr:dolichyl-phosphate mannosyltransferase polypeptide 2, regulatory subunit [Kwoniella dejecticola CBS 10117]OBR87816.1 dolichyl-phosphate mannosyltransferase polypeptide 2, regulatory subunit [Kwoniella dejecticola CBS 10117]